MIARDTSLEAVAEISKAEESPNSDSFNDIDESTLKAVIENDENVMDEGKLVSDAINQGFSSFTPDMMFDQLTKNFSMAKHIYGEKMLRLLSGYDPSYINKNIQIPEFQRELKEKIKDKIESMKDKGLLDRDGTITDEGVSLASLVLYTEELDNITPKGVFGEKIHKENSVYGEKTDDRVFRKHDRYRDIAVKKSLRLAIRRGHEKVKPEDLRVFERQSRGSIYVIYALDASGSMKGEKIEMAKKAGIALAYKAISAGDKVGLIVFGTEIKERIHPTSDFPKLLHEITKIRASRETNLTHTIESSIELFPKGDFTKHLIVLSDALPTIGKEPEEEAIAAVGNARSAGITISLVGINLDEKGTTFAERLSSVSGGRFYTVRNLGNMDKIILEDYYSFK